MGLSTGLRREELLGLRWADVDPTERALVVRHTVAFVRGKPVMSEISKTPAGWRTVHFDSVAATALDAQRQHVELAKTAATQWTDYDLVFASSVGTPLGESYLRRHYLRLIEEAGVPPIRIYDLRSTHGSILATAGVNPKAISERLGRADVAFTLRTYVKTHEAERRAAGNAFGEAIRWERGYPVAEDPATPATGAPLEAGSTTTMGQKPPSGAHKLSDMN